MNALSGLDVLVGYENKIRGEDMPEGDSDEQVNQDINDGMYEAVNELMGAVDKGTDTMAKVTPYLSALAPLLQSFQGGDDKKKAEEEAKKAEEERKKEEARQAASKKTTLWVVLGLLGAGVLGLGGYLVARKK